VLRRVERDRALKVGTCPGEVVQSHEFQTSIEELLGLFLVTREDPPRGGSHQDCHTKCAELSSHRASLFKLLGHLRASVALAQLLVPTFAGVRVNRGWGGCWPLGNGKLSRLPCNPRACLLLGFLFAGHRWLGA